MSLIDRYRSGVKAGLSRMVHLAVVGGALTATSATVQADNIPPIVVSFAGDAAAAVSHGQPRKLQVGTTASYIQRVKTRRTLYSQGKPSVSEKGPELAVAPGRASGITSVALGVLSFGPPSASQDGYYAEVLEFIGVTVSGDESVFDSRTLYFKIERGVTVAVTQREYSDAQGPTYEARDDKGQRIQVRDAKVVEGVPAGAPVFLTPEENP